MLRLRQSYLGATSTLPMSRCGHFNPHIAYSPTNTGWISVCLAPLATLIISSASHQQSQTADQQPAQRWAITQSRACTRLLSPATCLNVSSWTHMHTFTPPHIAYKSLHALFSAPFLVHSDLNYIFGFGYINNQFHSYSSIPLDSPWYFACNAAILLQITHIITALTQ
jgi:hypothetical protein